MTVNFARNLTDSGGTTWESKTVLRAPHMPMWTNSAENSFSQMSVAAKVAVTMEGSLAMFLAAVNSKFCTCLRMEWKFSDQVCGCVNTYVKRIFQFYKSKNWKLILKLHVAKLFSSIETHTFRNISSVILPILKLLLGLFFLYFQLSSEVINLSETPRMPLISLQCEWKLSKYFNQDL